MVSYYDSLADAGEIDEYRTTQSNILYYITGDIETLPGGVYEKLIDVCKRNYEKIQREYNSSVPARRVTINIDSGYTRSEPNYVIGDTIVVNPYWFVDHPKDIDSLTTALADVVINYNDTVPEWIETSLTVFVRDEMPVYDTENDWALPKKYAGGNYTDGYETGAAFLKWLNAHAKSRFVLALNSEALKDQIFNENVWKLLTGKTLDQLWKLYTEDK